MNTEESNREDALLVEAQDAPLMRKLGIYTRLSGPGWLQGAITLGGGSLAGALYLGVIAGFGLLWLQPLAMICGVIMLSAIAYVTLSTEKAPFGLVNTHLSPALGWAWIIATIMANIVWCLPQFALGTAAIQQNLAPGLAANDSGMAIAAGLILVLAVTVVWFYNSGSWGIKLFELILKIMVGIVVLSFFGVVIAMTLKGALDWGQIFSGFVPNVGYLFKPVPTLTPHIEATGDFSTFWHSYIANTQKDKIMAAFATAVGINMTFLLPYSMLRKGWGRDHRGLAIFDLSIGLIIPFVLATGCVLIASASQFHTQRDDVMALVQENKGKEVGSYYSILDKRLSAEIGQEQFKQLQSQAKATGDNSVIDELRGELSDADRALAAMLAERDNLSLANTLAPLVGSQVSQKLFGIGVLGMALSTIIILMLINGFAFCELLNVPAEGNMHRLGSLIPSIGVLGPFVWAKAAAALAIPTSVIGGAMLPIAYVTFFLLMNSRRVLGDAMPTGVNRLKWNVLMGIATLIALFGSCWVLMNKNLYGFPIGKVAIAALVVLLLLGIISFLKKNQQAAA